MGRKAAFSVMVVLLCICVLGALVSERIYVAWTTAVMVLVFIFLILNLKNTKQGGRKLKALYTASVVTCFLMLVLYIVLYVSPLILRLPLLDDSSGLPIAKLLLSGDKAISLISLVFSAIALCASAVQQSFQDEKNKQLEVRLMILEGKIIKRGQK